MLIFQVILSLASPFLKFFIIKGEGDIIKRERDIIKGEGDIFRAKGIRRQVSEWQRNRETVWRANTAK